MSDAASSSSSCSSSSPAGAAPPFAAFANAELDRQAPSLLRTSAGEAMALPRRVVRAVAAMKSLLTMLCGMAMLVTAALLLDTATLQAHSVSGSTTSAARDAHQGLLASLATLLGQCEGMLAINGDDDGAGTEVVLWLEDSRDVGRINADELAVVRHSPLFHTITLYSASRNQSPGGRQPAWRSALETIVVTKAEVAAPGAIDRWRADPAVGAKVIATGITSMTIEPVPAGKQRALSLFRLRLTWDAESSDGADSASAVVAAGRRRTGVLQEYQP